MDGNIGKDIEESDDKGLDRDSNKDAVEDSKGEIRTAFDDKFETFMDFDAFQGPK